MSTFFSKDRFSSCQVGGVIAEALIEDLRENLFTFANFPEVLVSHNLDAFEVCLKAHGQTTRALTFPRSMIKEAVRGFESRKPVSSDLVKAIQDLTAELEGLVSSSGVKAES